MKKIITLISLLLLSPFCFANTSTIEIISFSRVSDNAKNISAEVCGLVHRAEKTEKADKLGQADLIRLILDRKGKSPRVYYTYAGQTGIFRSLVTTVEGTVEAGIEGITDLNHYAKANLN